MAAEQARDLARLDQTSTSSASSFAALSWMNLKRSSGRRPISASISSEVRARSIVIDHDGVRSEIPLAPNAGGPTIYVR